jgi:hypothetical protein
MRIDQIYHIIKIEYKGQEYSSSESTEFGLNPIWNFCIDLIVTDPTEQIILKIHRKK